MGKSPGLAPGMVRLAGQLVWLHNLKHTGTSPWMGSHMDYTKTGKGLPVAWTSGPRRAEEAVQQNWKMRGPGGPRYEATFSTVWSRMRGIFHSVENAVPAALGSPTSDLGPPLGVLAWRETPLPPICPSA